ncbi:MAG: serine/threonine protein kinase [Lentisphaeraceae bacterium]|nr:serine/threonine protein kinase [Lentisphaeraceae bacterium]
MDKPLEELDSRLLKHFERAKLYENSEFDQRYINRDLLQENPFLNELNDIKERYEIGEEIGRGGMKRIEKALDHFTNRTVAFASIKSIENSEDIENFLREARLTASLQHQNIVPVYDLGLDQSKKPYFTMKLIEGENLNDIIKRIREGNRGYQNKYKLRTLIDIFLKVCDAVSYAHSHNIVHLDLKPHNIQVSDHGEVLLCDWGLARRLEEKPTVNFSYSQLKSLDDRESTLDTFIKGTPGYMSPEQASGHWNETSKKTDIFSLGAILYTILTLEIPFENSSVESMIDDTVNGNIIVPSYLAPDRNIPDALERICLKCMEVEKVARYVSVRKLADDIRAWEEGFVTSVEDSTLSGQLASFYKRNKKACFLGTGVLIAFVSLASFFLVLLYKSADRAERARQETQNTLNDLMLIEKEKQVLSKDASFRVFSKALNLVKNGDFTAAQEPLAYSLDLNPDLQESWRLKAQLNLIEGKVKKALKHALKSKDRKLISLIQRALSENMNNKNGGIESLLDYAQSVKELFWLDLIAEKLDTLPEESKVPVVIQLLKKENKLEYLQSYYTFENGRLILDLSNNKTLSEISSLSKLKIHELDLSETSVSKLGPLSGQPISKLDLFHTSIKGIRALQGMPIKHLVIEGSAFTDLSPLAGSPIEFIDLGRGKYDLKFLNSLQHLKKIELPQGLFTKEELKELRPDIEVTYRDFHIHKGTLKK